MTQNCPIEGLGWPLVDPAPSACRSLPITTSTGQP
jgi:hypothetical protein